MTDEEYMEKALLQAELAFGKNEVPVGGLLVSPHGAIIAQAFNKTITNCDPTAHAEMLVIKAAAEIIGNYRLLGCTLYVTLEPCAMCAGALVWARVSRVVFAAYDYKAGALGTVMDLNQIPTLNHCLEVQGGVLQAKSIELLQKFFYVRRKKEG